MYFNRFPLENALNKVQIECCTVYNGVVFLYMRNKWSDYVIILWISDPMGRFVQLIGFIHFFSIIYKIIIIITVHRIQYQLYIEYLLIYKFLFTIRNTFLKIKACSGKFQQVQTGLKSLLQRRYQQVGPRHKPQLDQR